MTTPLDPGLLAGITSTTLFVVGMVPMLVKVCRTRHMASYSLSQLLLSNTGNAVHWVYITSLPLGPIWFLHALHTLTSLFMLIWYIRWEVLRSLSHNHSLSRRESGVGTRAWFLEKVK